MSPTLSIHELAETEINEAADVYDVENPGLGGIFLDEVPSVLGADGSSIAGQQGALPDRRQWYRERRRARAFVDMAGALRSVS